MPFFKLRRLLAAAIFLALSGACGSAGAQTSRKVTKLADGVYAIEHADSEDGFSSGNTTVIIGDRQVFVVDACFLHSDARADIAQIRQWTDKPVSFVLNTHFHNDHNLGNRVYMDAFPALTIIAHAETKKEMDMFGPGSADREQQENDSLRQMLATGKTRSGRTLTDDEMKQVKDLLARRAPVVDELHRLKFQSATLTFDHDFSIDIGNRVVEIKFLGRGNTPGDAVAYLPAEKIVVTGDLVVYPVPYMYDGYPSEWIRTMDNLGRLDATTIVPGHGPVLHDKAYVLLIRDLMQSTVDQLNAKLRHTAPAMFQTVDDIRGAVDLSPFRQRFAGNDKDLDAAFDDMAKHLIKIAFLEASLR
jgi:glyoxylase-like metal-dependent hydrolase (beta-lactamase superfamily II)